MAAWYSVNAYSHLKAFRHPDVLEGIKRGVPRRVPHVELILADLCNQSCTFCAYRLDGYTSNQLFDDKRMMPIGKGPEIILDCAEIGVQGIQFTGGGEPTIHRDFLTCFRMTLDHGMTAALVSNGTRIDEDMAQVLARAAWVRISLDAATEETYVKVRRVHPSHFYKACNSVRLLRKAGAGVLGVGFVVTPDNWFEVVDAAKLAKDLGADNFRISAEFSQAGYGLFADFEARASALCAEAALLSGEGFEVYNRFDARVSDLRNGAPKDPFCGYQFFTTYIGADLNVYRCCVYAYNERGIIGSLREQSFKDLWVSQERFNEQMAFDARGCHFCQFNGQNQALAYVLNPEKQLHEEFV